jgi:hypothetical protein
MLMSIICKLFDNIPSYMFKSNYHLLLSLMTPHKKEGEYHTNFKTFIQLKAYKGEGELFKTSLIF